MAVGLAESVGHWVTALDWRDVPQDVREATVRGVLQSVAGGVAGFGMDETNVAVEIARRERERGDYTIYVDGMRVPVATAIFVHSVMFCALEQQEMHIESGTHPLEVIVPVAMVLAERRPTTGKEILEAILAGTEVTVAFAKAGMACVPQAAEGACQYAAVYGTLGAAVTAARLLGLDAQATTWALSHAANLASGLTQCLRAGTTEYHYALANASRTGYMVARLAEAGAAATPDVFLGNAGFFRRFTGLGIEELAKYEVAERITGHLGTVWEMPEHIYKRYAVHFNNLPFVDAAKHLRNHYHIAPEDVEAIHLTINQWCELCDGKNLGPYTGRESTCGATAFGVAAMLARGQFTLAENEDHDAPDIMQLVRRTTIDTFDDPQEAADWKSVKVEVLAHGTTYGYDS